MSERKDLLATIALLRAERDAQNIALEDLTKQRDNWRSDAHALGAQVADLEKRVLPKEETPEWEAMLTRVRKGYGGFGWRVLEGQIDLDAVFRLAILAGGEIPPLPTKEGSNDRET